MNRNRLILGFAILVPLVVLAAFGLRLLLIQWKARQPPTNQASPVSDLAYCSSNDTRPCIVSFSLDSNGNMLVNVLIPTYSFPDFHLIIRQSKGESSYECKNVEGFLTNIYCIGEKMPPGEILQFMIVSNNGDVLLAKGNFAIIGLALPTLEVAGSPTSSNQPTASPPSQDLFITTPTLTRVIPIKATPSPSYPNPSYPNSSYP